MTASQQKAIPGILGGLRPSAHTDFERKLIVTLDANALFPLLDSIWR